MLLSNVKITKKKKGTISNFIFLHFIVKCGVMTSANHCLLLFSCFATFSELGLDLILTQFMHFFMRINNKLQNIFSNRAHTLNKTNGNAFGHLRRLFSHLLRAPTNVWTRFFAAPVSCSLPVAL